jgi:glycyl-tRNA synthetase (class II)
VVAPVIGAAHSAPASKIHSEVTVMTNMKVCIKCCNEFPITSDYFYRHSGHKDGFRNECKSCRDIYVKEWVSNNRGKRYTIQLKSRCKKYGIELEEYYDMLKQQDNKCIICNTNELNLNRKLNIDHNHKTGEVRGLLCDRCNKVIGLLNEDINIMRSMIEYINKNGK